MVEAEAKIEVKKTRRRSDPATSVPAENLDGQASALHRPGTWKRNPEGRSL